MKHRAMLTLLAAAAAGVWLAAPAAVAKDDPAKIREKREDFIKDEKEKGRFLFYGLDYYVDAPRLKDTRWSWSDPPHSGAKHKEGLQLRCSWSPSATSADGAWIEVLIWKLPHKDGNSVFSYPFDSLGEKPQSADVDAIHECFFREWAEQQSTDVLEDRTVKPKKSNAGPADLFASATGTNKESKQRERRDFYAWRSPNTTWIARIVFSAPAVEKEEVLEKGEDFMKVIKEVKDKRAAWD